LNNAIKRVLASLQIKAPQSATTASLAFSCQQSAFCNLLNANKLVYILQMQNKELFKKS